MKKKQRDSENIYTNDKKLSCLNCGSSKFTKSPTIKRHLKFSFLAITRNTTSYTCNGCGLIHEFGDPKN